MMIGKDANNQSRHTQTTVPLIVHLKRWSLISIVLITVIVLATLFSIHIRVQSLTSLALTTIYQHFSAKPNPSSPVNLVTIKPPIMTNDEQINFEFYNRLPNMKFELAKAPVSPIEHNSSIYQASKPLPIHSKVIAFNPRDLEREFSKHLHGKQFVIQLGVFNQLAAAERFRQQCIKNGMSGPLVVIKEKNRTRYRVQQGPFDSLYQTKLAKIKLEKQGMSYLVKTVEKG